MPPVKFATPDAQSPALAAVHRSEYTDAQWRALDRVKQTSPALKLGAARNEFVNKVMLHDGTISDDLDDIRRATVQADKDDLVRLEEFTRTHRDDILKGTLDRELRPQLTDLQYWANHSQTNELEEHIEQKRFLFIVDANKVVRIYFQCVTEDNPDIEYANDAEDPTFHKRIARRNSFNAERLIRGG